MSAFENVRAALENELGIGVSPEVLRAALKTAGCEVLAPGDLFGPGAAAEYIGTIRTTVSRWERDGYMPEPFQKVGGASAWTREKLDEFKANHARTADAAGRRPVGTRDSA